MFNTFYYAGRRAGCSSSSSTSPPRTPCPSCGRCFGNLILGADAGDADDPGRWSLIIPQYLTVVDLPILHVNLLDSPFAIWLPAVANAFNIFLLKRFFDSIPEELMAAAAIDGASPLRTLWSIVLPMSRPILGVVSIFAVVAVWKDFLWPLLVLPTPDKQRSASASASLVRQHAEERGASPRW